MSYIGDVKIGKMFLGDTEIAKAYLGDTLVFQRGGGGATPVFYDYLVFDGTAIIQTDYLAPSQLSVLVNVGNETLKAYQDVFGWLDTNGKISLCYGGATNTSRRQVMPNYDSPGLLATNRYLEFTYPSYDFYMTPAGFGWGSVFYNYTKGNAHPSTGLIFGSGPQARPFTGTLGEFKVYGSDAAGVRNTAQFANYTPVATFRPCTYNGDAGMWFVEQNRFYGNTAGSGTLSVQNIS